MIVFKSKWLTLGTVWFDEKPTTAKVDVIRYQHRKERLVGTESKEVYTLVNDLTKSSDDILSAMTKDTRYEIRRATDRDKINCQHWNTNLAHPLARFIHFYDECAERKNIPRAPAAYLRVMADAGVLDLSCTLDEEGKDLVWHAYYRGPWRVVLLHSGSIFRESKDRGFRNFIGRANRFHHWQDMLRFKADGIIAYDFGGWYQGNSHQEFLRVNRFKEEFGGTVVQEFNCRQLITAKAHVASLVSKVLKRVN